jgi:transcriptional regulator GlxA family with amidase domain
MCRTSWADALTEAHRLAGLSRLRRVRDRLDREDAGPLDVEALARDLHLPAGQLVRQFRAAYGQSPYDYVATRRLERAAPLLWPGGLPVTEVRVAAGPGGP